MLKGIAPNYANKNQDQPNTQVFEKDCDEIVFDCDRPQPEVNKGDETEIRNSYACTSGNCIVEREDLAEEKSKTPQ